MSNEQQYMIPAPVATIMQSLDDLGTAYEEFRQAQGPTEAFASALAEVLANEDYDVVASYLNGEMDATYGAGSGRGLYNKLLDTFESSNDQMVATHEKFARWQRMTDIVDLAQEVATDPATTHTYRRVLERGDVQQAAALVGEIVALLGRVANSGWTRMGKGVKLQQAQKVIQLLGAKAARVPGDPKAESQAIWCAALAEALR